MRPQPSNRNKPSSYDLPSNVALLLNQSDVTAADRLQELGIGSGAEAKAARRALFLLKQKGIEPSTAPEPEQAVAVAIAPRPVVKGFLSNVSGSSSQMVFFEETDPFGGASMYHFFLTNFASGLDDVVSRRIPRREVPAMLARLKRGEGGFVVDAPPEYAMSLVLRAADRLSEQGGRLPQGYADAIRRIGIEVSAPVRPLIYESIDADSMKDDLSFSREPESFFKSVYFRSWFLAMETVALWEEKYFEAVQSRFAVDQAQRDALGDKVIEEATDAILDRRSMTTLRSALEEQASVLQLAGHEAEARQALHHALSIDPEQPARTNPFLLFYVKRSIYVVMAYKAEQEPEPEEEAAEKPAASLIERV